MARFIVTTLCGLLASATFAQQPPSRADLAIPSDLWREVLDSFHHPGPALGFSGDVMRNYRFDTHLLRSVQTLFTDVRALPRYSGKISDELIAAASDPARLLWFAHTLTDISAARDIAGPPRRAPDEPIAWGISWLPEGADPTTPITPTTAFTAALQRLHTPSPDQPGPTLPDDWHRLPEPAQRLAARLLIAIAEATPYMQLAYPEILPRAIDKLGGGPEATYHLATAPWTEEREWQFVTTSADSFRLLSDFDRHYTAFASILLARFAWDAIQEYLASPADLAGLDDFPPLRINTPRGQIIILGPGDDSLEADHPLLVLDLGGDDTYRGHIAAAAGPQTPISVLVDLSGADTYDGESRRGAFAAGIFGIAMLFDLAGNDTYRVQQSGLGSAHFGAALLYDAQGDDSYTVHEGFAQGSGIAGLGMLVDLTGNDHYSCGKYSQGLGGTLGAGILLDLAGDDRYIARDDGNISEMYGHQSVAMSQGCGWGRRADFGDGHSLAGGVGALIDVAGDDHYHAQVWAQGCGFWWGLGMLEDRAGDDTYRNGKYSAGAAAHFALGVCIDLAGNDRHNLDNDTAVNQFLGHARDGSLAVFFDGDGDDQYMLRDHCGGSADLGSVALFWDRGGDDLYTLNPAPPKQGQHGNDNTPALGTSTWYIPMRTFRDDLPTYGIFLDTGGRDRYEGRDRREPRPADNSTWNWFHPWASWGIGIDRD